MKLIIAGIFASLASAHVQIKSPPPRNLKFSKYYRDNGKADDIMTDPLSNEFGFNKPYPCKGIPVGPSQATLTAGSTIDIEFDIGINHNGGHCQFGLSWNNAKNIVTFQTILRTCLSTGSTIPVTIPSTAPPGDSTLTWTWVNASGNREYYMNCVDVTLVGGPLDGMVTGPENLKVNMPGAERIGEFSVQGDRTNLFNQRPIITLPQRNN